MLSNKIRNYILEVNVLNLAIVDSSGPRFFVSKTDGNSILT